MTEVNSRNAPEDWGRFVSSHQIGAEVEGRVTSLVSFGAFVEVAPGVEGLLHESQFVDAPALGSTLSVRIDRIDVEARRMSLATA